MEQILHNAIYAFRRKGSTVFLAFFFFLGLITGLYCFLRTEALIFSLMRGCFINSVSIVKALISSLFPFLLSAFAFFFSLPWMVYLASFFEAFLFIFVSLLALFTFHPVGFLVRFFLLIGDIVAMPIMYFFWHRWLFRKQEVPLSELFLFISLGLLIGCIECCVFFPFCEKYII